MHLTSAARRAAAIACLAAVSVTCFFLVRAGLIDEEQTRIYGNATGTVVRHVLRVQPLVLTIAAVLAVAGVVATGWLWPRRPRFPVYAATSAVVVATVLIAAVPIITARRGDISPAGPSLVTRTDLIAALRDADLACVKTGPAPDSTVPNAFICLVQTPAGQDGTARVTVGLWDDPKQRSEWLERNDHERTFGVAGPTWVAVCQFQATCAQIQDRVGGRNF